MPNHTYGIFFLFHSTQCLSKQDLDCSDLCSYQCCLILVRCPRTVQCYSQGGGSAVKHMFLIWEVLGSIPNTIDTTTQLTLFIMRPLEMGASSAQSWCPCGPGPSHSSEMRNTSYGPAERSREELWLYLFPGPCFYSELLEYFLCSCNPPPQSHPLPVPTPHSLTLAAPSLHSGTFCFPLTCCPPPAPGLLLPGHLLAAPGFKCLRDTLPGIPLSPAVIGVRLLSLHP